MWRERQLGSSEPLRVPQALPEEAGLSLGGSFPTAEEKTPEMIHKQKKLLGTGTPSVPCGVQWGSRLPRPLGSESFISWEGALVGFIVTTVFIVVCVCGFFCLFVWPKCHHFEL